jgi:glutaredoxin-dependent peroxiredoxin
MPLAVGSKAPDFTLKSKVPDDADVKLSANFGQKNTVLLFFPLAFTGVCTTEMCDMTSGLGAYTALNADVIAISVDSPFAQQAWAEERHQGPHRQRPEQDRDRRLSGAFPDARGRG